MTTQQESKAGHTPTPWYRQQYTIKSVGTPGLKIKIIETPKNEFGENTHGSFEENADFIIRAVHSHEALLKTCKDMMSLYKKVNGQYQHAFGPETVKAFHIVLTEMENAIKQAEGK